MVNQLSPGFGVPSCRQVPELSPSCSITYKLPIFYPLCFDIHASDVGCRGSLPSLNVQTFNVAEVQISPQKLPRLKLQELGGLEIPAWQLST